MQSGGDKKSKQAKERRIEYDKRPEVKARTKEQEARRYNKKLLFKWLESGATAEEQKQVQAWFKAESGKAASAKTPVGGLGQVLEVWQGVQQLGLECQDRLERLERLERGEALAGAEWQQLLQRHLQLLQRRQLEWQQRAELRLRAR